MSEKITREKRDFLHISLKLFFVNRFKELISLIVMFLGVGLAIALLTYSPSDLSLNYESSKPIKNLLGYPGSVVADIAHQGFGLSSYIIVLTLSIWGVSLFYWKEIEKLYLKIFLFFITLLSASTFLATIEQSLIEYYNLGLGGVIGDRIKFLLYSNTNLAISNNAKIVLSIVLGILSIISLFLSLSVKLSYIKKFFTMFFNIISIFLNFLKRVYQSIKKILFSETKKQEKIVSKDPYFEDNVIFKHDSKNTSSQSSQQDTQENLYLKNTGEYSFPDINLLTTSTKKSAHIEINKEKIKEQASLLQNILNEFGIQGEIVDVTSGPIVTLYELKPAPGIKASRIISLADDIARNMSAVSARVAPVPERNVIGIEIPNTKREVVFLGDLLSSSQYQENNWNLPLAFGKDIAGNPIFADLTEMPHLLVAGTTGSGKSVGINSMILSLLFKLPPDKCKFILIDPKMIELSTYEIIPHLLHPVVKNPRQAVSALKWTTVEMEKRYQKMALMGVRNITGYNKKIEIIREKNKNSKNTNNENEAESQMKTLPYIVVIVDEMADLMLIAGKEIETVIQRLSQMARAAGIHLIMATQRPSVDVITGIIKSNFPSRMSFQVPSKIDSRTVLGEQGAEQLLGKGDMLYMSAGGRTIRIHSPFVSDDEVMKITNFLSKNNANPFFESNLTSNIDEKNSLTEDKDINDNSDEFYNEAIKIVKSEGKVSTSFLQRKLQIGYNRAARIVEKMEENSIVSSANHVGKRKILINEE